MVWLCLFAWLFVCFSFSIGFPPPYHPFFSRWQTVFSSPLKCCALLHLICIQSSCSQMLIGGMTDTAAYRQRFESEILPSLPPLYRKQFSHVWMALFFKGCAFFFFKRSWKWQIEHHTVMCSGMVQLATQGPIVHRLSALSLWPTGSFLWIRRNSLTANLEQWQLIPSPSKAHRLFPLRAEFFFHKLGCNFAEDTASIAASCLGMHVCFPGVGPVWSCRPSYPTYFTKYSNF